MINKISVYARVVLGIITILFLVGSAENIYGEETAKEVVDSIGMGWNLGNQLDCWNSNKNSSVDETAWGNPSVSKQLINEVHNAGFNSIRIPVTYYNHMDDEYNIDKKWLDQVAKIVQYVIDNDMYCIINVHHDTGSDGWLTADATTITQNKKRLAYMWKQIATYFKEYDGKLIFEGFNEILNTSKKWDYAGTTTYDATNQLNQTFVDTVRKSGGKNANRILCVNTYAASSSYNVMSGFELPKDTIDNKIIVGIHCYNSGDVSGVFSNINKCFITKDIPVIIGEFGSVNKNNTIERQTYILNYLSNANKYNIPCFWWDDGQVCSTAASVKNYALINRKTSEWYFPELVSLMMTQTKKLENNMSSSLLKGEDISDCDLSLLSNWRSGNYDMKTGIYATNTSRICLLDYKTTAGNVTYKISSSEKQYHVLIRELNADKVMIKSSDLMDGDEFTTNANTRYLGVSIYNASNGAIRYTAYQTLFKDGYKVAIDKNVVDAVEDEEQSDSEPIADDSILECDLSDFTNWRSGNYDMKTGLYVANASRICLIDYKTTAGNVTYKISSSEKDYHILIRELNADKVLIKSSDLTDGSEFLTDANTKYLGVSIYNVNNGAIKYNTYQNLFINGYKVVIAKTVSDTVVDEVEQPDNDQAVGDSILECDLNDFANWRSGNYDMNAGTYTTNAARICLLDYKTTDGNVTYKISSSEKNYHILVRELDADKVMIKSSDLTDGSEFTTDVNTQYLGISIYNVNNGAIKYTTYQTLFKNGYRVSIEKNTSGSVADETEQPDSEQLKEDSILECNLSDFANWRSGCYDMKTGIYATNTSRICLLDFKTSEGNITYMISSSQKEYHILVRELDKNKSLIKSSDLTDGSKFTTDVNTKYLGVSIYNVSNGAITYGTYKNLFNDGYVASIKISDELSDEDEEEEVVIVGDAQPATPPVEDTSIDAFKAEIKQMVLTGDMTTHDISKYNLQFIPMDKAWNELKANDQEFYFATLCYGAVYLQPTKNSAGICETVYLMNADSDFQARYLRAQNEVNAVVTYITNHPEMTELDKLIYIHDYIVFHTTYKQGTTVANSVAPGILLGDGYGICEAYAGTLQYLLDKVGIEAVRCVSDGMNHMWNCVKIDGEWYQVDCTWDDRDTKTDTGIRRTYLLRTDAEFTGTCPLKHYGWSILEDTTITCISDRFANWFVHDISEKMYYYNGNWYYVKDNNIMKAKSDGSYVEPYIVGGADTVTITDVVDAKMTYSRNGVTAEQDLNVVTIGEGETPLSGGLGDIRVFYTLIAFAILICLTGIARKKIIR